MKHFNRHHLAILPLLSILAMSPSVVETKYSAERSIASVTEEVKGHPKYEALVEKVKPESVKDVEITPEKFKEKLGEVKLNLMKDREDFKKDLAEEAVVSEQRKSIESRVVDLLLIEGSLKQLEEQKLLEEADISSGKQVIAESKDIVESLLADLEANEVLVAQAKEPKVEDKPVIAEEPKKEEPKVEEPKAEDKPVIAEEPKKEEPKAEEPKKEICEAEEQNKVLTAQVQDLMKQQNQILQAMIGMTNMMVSMFQQQQQQQPQQNPYYANGPGWQSSPYQYQQPMSAGNWVYYPSGFQPNQQNIFAQQPMQYQAPMQQQHSIYPDQMHMQQSAQPSWGLQPTNFFADPRYQTQPQISYGSFGTEPFSYNMAANNFPTTALR